MEIFFITISFILFLMQIGLLVYSCKKKPLEKYYNILNIVFLFSLFPAFKSFDTGLELKFFIIVLAVIWSVIYIVLNLKAAEDYKLRAK